MQAGVTAAHRFAQTRTSITWRVNAERIVLLGWARAILLQLAHPLVAAGVFDHSGFRGTPYAAASRLYHTVHAMLSLTFGDEVARERTLEGIRAIHRRVNGVLPERLGRLPRRHSVFGRRSGAGLVGARDTPRIGRCSSTNGSWRHSQPPSGTTIVSEAFPIAVALAAREDEVPKTWADLRGYLDRMYSSDAIVVGTQGRELAQLCSRPLVAGWSRLPFGSTVTIIGLLPSHGPRTVRDDLDATTMIARSLVSCPSLRLTAAIPP